MSGLAQCNYGNWPYTGKPSCGAWSSGPWVEYLQAVLMCRVGDTDFSPSNLTQSYDGRTFNGVLAVQHWYNAYGWNLPEDGYMSQQMWNIFDQLAVHY